MKRGMNRRRTSAVAGVLASALVSSAAQAIVIYVDDNAAAGGDGLTWNTAYQFLQDALTFANVSTNSVSEIRIAQGVYKPDRDEAHPLGTGDRAASFRVRRSLALRGGYAGVGAPDPDVQDIAVFETILSGDLAGDDQPGFVNSQENSLHVLKVVPINDNGISLTLDGLTVSGGHADALPDGNYYPEDSRGGGLDFVHTNAQISHCTFCQNFARGWGAGLYGSGSNIAIHLSDCTVRDNAARLGGGITIQDGTLGVDHCAFQNNKGGHGGGAISVYYNLTANDSIFEDNTAPHGNGGAISCAQVSLARCTFRANNAEYGGALSADDTAQANVDCIFDSNSAEYGGALYLGPDGNAGFQRCVFMHNDACEQGGAALIAGNNAVLEDCIFDSNATEHTGGALANMGVAYDDSFSSCAPAIRRCTFVHNRAKTGGAMYNRGAEPMVIGCRFDSNLATARGGAIANFGLTYFESGYMPKGGYIVEVPSRPRLLNCVIWDNASAKGGAMYSNMGNVTIINSTLAANRAIFAGDIFSESSATLRAYNSIMKATGAEPLGGDGARILRYCDILGGHIGIGNVNVDPQFVDDLRGDLRLSARSPCIDAGRNAYVPGLILTDMAGSPRFRDDPDVPDTGNGTPYVVDMGAYEF